MHENNHAINIKWLISITIVVFTWMALGCFLERFHIIDLKCARSWVTKKSNWLNSPYSYWKIRAQISLFLLMTLPISCVFLLRVYVKPPQIWLKQQKTYMCLRWKTAIDPVAFRCFGIVVLWRAQSTEKCRILTAPILELYRREY
jgi:hypothetical protein